MFPRRHLFRRARRRKWRTFISTEPAFSFLRRNHRLRRPLPRGGWSRRTGRKKTTKKTRKKSRSIRGMRQPVCFVQIFAGHLSTHPFPYTIDSLAEATPLSPPFLSFLKPARVLRASPVPSTPSKSEMPLFFADYLAIAS